MSSFCVIFQCEQKLLVNSVLFSQLFGLVRAVTASKTLVCWYYYIQHVFVHTKANKKPLFLSGLPIKNIASN